MALLHDLRCLTHIVEATCERGLQPSELGQIFSSGLQPLVRKQPVCGGCSDPGGDPILPGFVQLVSARLDEASLVFCSLGRSSQYLFSVLV